MDKYCKIRVLETSTETWINKTKVLETSTETWINKIRVLETRTETKINQISGARDYYISNYILYEIL